MDNIIRQNLPSKAFDMEYSTMWGREVKFLYSKGIKYVFIRKTRDYGLSVFKYKKTPELFKALIEFYTQVENERTLAAAEKEMQEGIPVKSPEDLEKAMQKLGLHIIIGDDGQPKFIANAD